MTSTSSVVNPPRDVPPNPRIKNVSSKHPISGGTTPKHRESLAKPVTEEPSGIARKVEKKVAKSEKRAASHSGSTTACTSSSLSVASTGSVSLTKQVALFSHLQPYDRERLRIMKGYIHPAVLHVALQFANRVIVGSNGRCIAMLTSFKQVIRDYTTPSQHVLKRHLDMHLKPMINYLVQARPMAMSMGNAIRYLKLQIANVEPDMPEAEAKQHLCTCIDGFISERILVADERIADYGAEKISHGDVVLTLGKSSLIQHVFLEAHRRGGKQFRVVIVDARPHLEGRQLLRILIREGIPCTYVWISAIAHIMSEVTKVFLGAHGMYANGTVLGRAGTALVAMSARACNVPVICCCESYKFSERVQLDSFVFNELGDPEEVVKLEDVDESPSVNMPAESTTTGNVPWMGQAQLGTARCSILHEWKEIAPLKVLNLVYDLTPAEYITMVITEYGMVPCTSVPVVLREHFGV